MADSDKFGTWFDRILKAAVVVTGILSVVLGGKKTKQDFNEIKDILNDISSKTDPEKVAQTINDTLTGFNAKTFPAFDPEKANNLQQ